jgi:hypothetical protein
MPVIETGQDNTADQGAVEEQAKIDAARAELYDEAAGGQPPEQEEEGEDLILGKYKSQDDLVEAYKNLQRENARLRDGDVDEEPEAGYESDDDDDDDDEDDSSITPEEASRILDSVHKQTGGQDKLQALLGWASQNLDESRINAFNSSLDTGDESTILAQVKGIQYDYMMATGYEPKLTGGRAPTNDVRGFESEAQVIAAMQDPRYGNDPAYIKEVEKRIAVSNVFNQR